MAALTAANGIQAPVDLEKIWTGAIMDDALTHEEREKRVDELLNAGTPPFNPSSPLEARLGTIEMAFQKALPSKVILRLLDAKAVPMKFEGFDHRDALGSILIGKEVYSNKMATPVVSALLAAKAFIVAPTAGQLGSVDCARLGGRHSPIMRLLMKRAGAIDSGRDPKELQRILGENMLASMARLNLAFPQAKPAEPQLEILPPQLSPKGEPALAAPEKPETGAAAPIEHAQPPVDEEPEEIHSMPSEETEMPAIGWSFAGCLSSCFGGLWGCIRSFFAGIAGLFSLSSPDEYEEL